MICLNSLLYFGNLRLFCIVGYWNFTDVDSLFGVGVLGDCRSF